MHWFSLWFSFCCSFCCSWLLIFCAVNSPACVRPGYIDMPVGHRRRLRVAMGLWPPDCWWIARHNWGRQVKDWEVAHDLGAFLLFYPYKISKYCLFRLWIQNTKNFFCAVFRTLPCCCIDIMVVTETRETRASILCIFYIISMIIIIKRIRPRTRLVCTMLVNNSKLKSRVMLLYM